MWRRCALKCWDTQKPRASSWKHTGLPKGPEQCSMSFWELLLPRTSSALPEWSGLVGAQGSLVSA